MIKQFFITIAFFYIFNNGYTQIVDKVVAVVGNNAILLSDIENQYYQTPNKKEYDNIDLKCNILEELIYQNFLNPSGRN